MSGNCYAQSSASKTSDSSPTAAAKQSQQDLNSEDDSFGKKANATTDSSDYENTLGLRLLKNIAEDQKAIWTSPARLRREDTIWLVPLGGLTAGLIATDTDVSKHLSNSPSRIKHSNDLSNYGVASLAAVGGGLYLLGHITHDDHKRETGLLAGEAALDSLAVTYAAKYAFGRERPLEDDYRGRFWQGGDSFPSEHSSAAWSIASVIAHEYPGPLTTFLAYGAASAISVSRVTAKQHFPSDVLIGDAIGWFVGQEVYRRHHDPELGGGEWNSPVEALLGDHPYQPKNMGSPYVPLDSWIYPALDRLQALGYVPEGFLGQRPWTRMECARLISDASDKITADSSNTSVAGRIVRDLSEEFASELNLLGGGTNVTARVESVYTRVTGISGQPLGGEAAYNFGQTIVNDDGRPYVQGANVISGGSGWATAGPLLGYIRAEYQYAPSAPPLPLSARLVMQQVQLREVQPGLPLPPVPPGNPVPSTSQVDLLDGYVGMQFDNWAITFGKQEQWWGPDQSGPMLFSTNASPIEMFEINRVTPFVLPSILRYAGPIRVQFFLGQLTGQNWVNSIKTGLTGSWTQPLNNQPAIDGLKISLKPTPNLEIGMGVTTILAGSGVALTPHKILQAFYSFSDTGPGSAGDPGSRHGGFDFTYRIPKLRNWLTLYADAYTNDEVSPWVRWWTKAAVISGIYMPRVPKVPKLDFRAEGLYTDPPAIQTDLQHGFFYFNDRFVSGYTSGENLIGSWVGRQGQGADAWMTYWFTPKDNLQFNFRHEKVSKQLLPNGGTITDAGARASFWWRSTLSFSASLQYETWDFPVISATKQTDVSTSVAVTFWPASRLTRAGAGSVGGEP
jgi:hypothetical protein